MGHRALCLWTYIILHILNYYHSAPIHERLLFGQGFAVHSFVNFRIIKCWSPNAHLRTNKQQYETREAQKNVWMKKKHWIRSQLTCECMMQMSFRILWNFNDLILTYGKIQEAKLNSNSIFEWESLLRHEYHISYMRLVLSLLKYHWIPVNPLFSHSTLKSESCYLDYCMMCKLHTINVSK